jgi:hypothetical protein
MPGRLRGAVQPPEQSFLVMHRPHGGPQRLFDFAALQFGEHGGRERMPGMAAVAQRMGVTHFPDRPAAFRTGQRHLRPDLVQFLHDGSFVQHLVFDGDPSRKFGPGRVRGPTAAYQPDQCRRDLLGAAHMVDLRIVLCAGRHVRRLRIVRVLHDGDAATHLDGLQAHGTVIEEAGQPMWDTTSTGAGKSAGNPLRMTFSALMLPADPPIRTMLVMRMCARLVCQWLQAGAHPENRRGN